MIPTNFQKAEIRDSNDNIIQQGAYGKNSALSNATNDGWIDYVMNNLEALKGESDQAATVEYVDETLTNYATLESPALTGTPTAPTPTAGDDSTKVATTAFVQDAIDDANGYTDTEIATAVAAEVTRSDGAYLPFTGGTITGNLSVNGTLTGNLTGNVTGDVTGDLTGNADTATNATNDANGNPITSTYLPLAGGTLTGAVNGVTPTAGDDSTKVATTAYVQEELRQHASMPIGHEYFTMNPNVPQGSLPLFGGEYSRATYADLWAWVQQQTGYLKTDAEWQALAASNNGNVPYYSDGDGSTTFRVPALKCYIKAADGTVTEVGSYYAAGLPNITGGGWNVGGASQSDWSGAFKSGALSGYSITAGTAIGGGALTFDASFSNSIYGNSNTVTPETVVGLWLVKAYGVIQDTGTINEQQYIDDRFAAAKDYTDSEIAAGVPTGCVQAFAGNNTPAGWLLCDGAAVSRITYAALFSVIGTSYGDGDGSTTFNVPNLINKFVEGSATVGTEKTAGLPNITGNRVLVQAADNSAEQGLWVRGGNGALYADGSWARTGTLSSYSAHETYTSNIAFDASRSNSIYGGSTTVQPPALTMRYIIKY